MKTKNFEEYLLARLDKKEITEIERVAKAEADQLQETQDKAFGMWKDRGIKDSVEYVRKLRKKEWGD